MMNPKRILIVGTMALTITISSGVWGKTTNANAILTFPLEALDIYEAEQSDKDEFLSALGASSDTEVYDSLLEGKSLAGIAGERHKDLQPLIDLQVAELTRQLDERLASGTLPPELYEAQKAELPDLIRSSLYSQWDT